MISPIGTILRVCIRRELVKAIAMVMLVVVHGCSSLTPYAQIRNSIPADQFARIDDQWVHFESAGDGPVVVLLHGFGGSTYSWRETLPRLAQRGFRAVAIDLNGFGYSERPEDPDAYSPDGQTKLVLNVIDSLTLGQVHLVGHSYGAGIAARIALANPDRVKSLTLVDGGASSGGGPRLPQFLGPFFLCYVKHWALREDSIRDALKGSVYREQTITSEVAREYLKRLKVEGLDSAFYGLTASRNQAPAPDVSKLATPTLVMWGVHDSVFPISFGEALTERISIARLVRFEESGHLPMEEQPDQFAESLVTFLIQFP